LYMKINIRRQATAWQKSETACHLRPRKWFSAQNSTKSFCGWSDRQVETNRSLHVTVLNKVSSACRRGSKGFHLKLATGRGPARPGEPKKTNSDYQIQTKNWRK
jgi:hypothetical protein